MKKITTDNITTSVGMPIKSGTLQHLQSAYQEALDALSRSILGAVDPAKIYVLWGCVNSGSYPNYDISEGAVYYNGEIFHVPAANFTLGIVGPAVASISTSYYTGTNADPVQFTSGITYNVHEIRQITIAEQPSIAYGVALFDDFIRNQWQSTDVSGDISINTGSATITSAVLKYKRVGDVAYVQFYISGTALSPSIGRFDLTITLPAILTAIFIGYEQEQPTASAAFDVHGTINPAFAYIPFGGEDQLKIKTTGSTTGIFTIGGQLTYQVAP
ncbi:hypothetical protein UFOVP579_16 [uncultured Caudovirales phage]|uniref:Uncharacterized protein n=1 Tax=uncultured Caudovirales phage TaxID=2100421 RepID=A0A6J5PHN4_9CAUD|nr:hypothetical protein UFOVP302_16 [uncultured Caudovirales phage]CAB4168668.1 hypothetical protein UFOVP579_16 [uncultured Caudovirales phage]